MHRSRVFLVLLLAFLGGVAFASLFTGSSNLTLYALIAGTGILAVSAYQGTFGNSARGVRYRIFGLILGCALLAFAGGMQRFYFVQTANSTLLQFADRQAGGDDVAFTVRGYIDGEIEPSGRGVRMPFHVRELIVPRRTIAVNERIMLYADVFPQYDFGDSLRLTGALRTPVNTSDFDYKTYLRGKNIQTIMSFPHIEENTSGPALSFAERIRIWALGNIFSLKHVFADSVGRALPEPHAAYVQGILLGSRGSLPEQLNEAFQITGTSHVLAISGYNIMLVAQALVAGAVWIWPRRKAIWFASAGVIIFTILTGASASVVRAAIMGLLILFASGMGRLYDVRISLALAAAVMVFFNPYLLVFDIGFQLSFAAVLGLVFIAPIIGTALGMKVPGGGLSEMVIATLSAQLAVLPLLIGYFQQVSLVSIIANALILPLMPLAMLFGFLAGAAGMASQLLGRGIGIIAWAITSLQLAIVKFFAAVPFAAFSVELSWLTVFIIYIAGAFIAWRLYRRIAYVQT